MSLTKALLFTLFFALYFLARGQDTLCYKKVTQFSIDSSLDFSEVVPSYNGECLLLINSKNEKTLSMQLIDTTNSVLCKKEFSNNHYRLNKVGITTGGGFFILLYNFGTKNNKGKSEIVEFDNKLNILNVWKINHFDSIKYHESLYKCISYCEFRKDSILLVSSFLCSRSFALKINKSKRSVDITHYPYVYDIEKRKLVKLSNKENTTHIHSSEKYTWVSPTTSKEPVIHINKNSTELSQYTLFIKNGFATFPSREKVVIYRFCN